jgi:type III secretion protein U
MGQDSGDKTEKPTDKKLRDARKKGEIPKSKEVTSTLMLLVWLGLGAVAIPAFGVRLSVLIQQSIDAVQMPFSHAMPMMGWAAIELTMWVMAVLMGPLVLVAILVEYMQAGPVFTFERLMPKLENLDPVAGVKRMFSADNLMEVLKAFIKTVVMLIVGWLVIKALLPQIAMLLQATPPALSEAYWQVSKKLLSWTVGIFAFVAAMDIFWQHHSFTKKHMMSMHDIKQEHKESEGDPHVKQQRKRAYQEWSQRNAAKSAASANVLVVNPTHVAIAIDYDPLTCPVPTVIDKGEDDVAMAMREAAEEAGVPVVRNIELARELLARVERGNSIPRDLFGVIADVVLWARDVRSRVKYFEQNGNGDGSLPTRDAPGEDMSRYPEGFDVLH